MNRLCGGPGAPEVAVELRKRGWDPIELLLSAPDEPASPGDVAAGGIEGAAPARRRWLHAPEEELALLETRIAERAERGKASPWHVERRSQLLRLLKGRR